MALPRLLLLVVCSAGLAGLAGIHAGTVAAPSGTRYRIEKKAERAGALRETFDARQLALLETLNRADLAHLEQLPEVVIPDSWSDDELSYSALPARYPSSDQRPKLLIVHLPGQLFGAYEFGSLVRWGPVSSGGRSSPTGAGFFALNWRSKGRASTVDPDWFMQWYFNFGNREGLAFHEYALPGYPASHGCIRLLERDAQWLFDWGQSWLLDASGTRVVKLGTPVLIVGAYDFDSTPPWRSLRWLSQQIDLLPLSALTATDTVR